MDLSLTTYERNMYRSRSQHIRVATESWCGSEMYCVSCDSDRIVPTPINTSAIDFVCPRCEESFQLKSGARISDKLPDGAFSAMLAAIQQGKSPNLLVLKYSQSMSVEFLAAIPSCFLTVSALERRKPLAASARRHGWIGCNILLARIPPDGKIEVVAQRECRDRNLVRGEFARAKKAQAIPLVERGWTLDVLNVARELKKPTFTLEEMYSKEDELQSLYPHNKNIRPKIRQQLQVLRDLRLVEFLGGGRYRFIEASAAV